MIKKVLTIAAVSVATMMLSGCASTADDMQAKGYGPDYSQGYGAGCETGKKSAGDMFSQFKKDVNRFDRNGKYREGWNDGFRTCKSEFSQIERNVRANSRDQVIRDSYQGSSRSESLDNVARDAARNSVDNMSYSDRRALQNLGR